jgi:hypothetical protein
MASSVRAWIWLSLGTINATTLPSSSRTPISLIAGA